MQEQITKRPLGITLLSMLHMLGALILLVLAIFLVGSTKGQEIYRQGSERLGVLMPMLVAGGVILLILSATSAAGMWTGLRWGWFLGSFYYLYGVLRHICAIFNIQLVQDVFASETSRVEVHDLKYNILKYGIRAVFYFLLYLYFFKGTVREYFGLREKKVGRYILAQLTVCLLLYGSFTIVGNMSLGEEQNDSTVNVLSDKYDKGEYSAVISGAEKFLRENPDSVEVWSLRGWAYSELDNYAEAKKCFEKTLALDPKWENGYVGLGAICHEMGDMAGSRSNYMKALEIKPDSPEALSSILGLELAEGNIQKAVEYGEKAWQLDSSDPLFAANLSIAYHYAGDTDKRDRMLKIAEKLGYHEILELRDFFK